MKNPVRYQPLAPAAGTRVDLASQATAIEQSRAIAEVQAAVFVAQERPRNKALAVEEMRDATAQVAVAETAFFRYTRGDGAITGVSIHLARELARCWGNIDYGIKELRRDDTKGESEMLAHAWDMQTNARASTTFIVPHIRDTRSGAKQLTETRDIYENNANNGARRLREQILAVLPKWFVEEAKANCHETLKRGDGDPLEKRRTNAIQGFAGIGVTLAQLEAKLGAAQAEWTPDHLGQLAVIFKSIQRGEINKADEFPVAPPQDATAEDIKNAGRKADSPGSEEPQTESADAPPTESPQSKQRQRKARQPKISDEQLQQARTLLAQLGVEEGDDLRYLSEFFKRDVTDARQLTEDEGAELIGELFVAIAEAHTETKGGEQ
ncbi:hypothetical protein [Nocardia asiatica]|uniref:hypothetical protein n=1 Tax=Nocardia asiatica TaxID=209252 RepID=UPI002456BDC7|nr:hypothetical protein [Nocardia asiatica]